MRKFILMVFSVLLLTSLVSCKKGADYKAKLSDFEYVEYGLENYILEKYIGSQKSIKVPDGKITRETFAFNEDITEIVYAGSVPAYAFEGCKNLKVVKVAGSIGAYAFKGCENLEEIYVDSYNIDPTAFIDCKNLKVINKYDSSTLSYFSKEKTNMVYEGEMLLGTSSLVNTKAYSITKIGDYAFYGRNVLKSVNLPAGIEEIGKAAFGGCYNLERISVDSANTVFDSRDNSNAIILSNKNALVVGCKNTIIPNDIQSIEAYAFVDCDLSGIAIPIGVKSISNQAFIDCNNIEVVSVSVNNLTYDSRENCNAIIETATDKMIFACNSTVIPSSVTTIGSYAFSNSNVDTLVIPNTVTTIEDYAFANMKNLKSITIPASITSINSTIFDGCDNLETVIVEEGNPKYDCRENCNAVIETETNKIVLATKNTVIPNSVKIIGQGVFEGFDMTNIQIPAGVTTIEDYAFSNCTNATNLIIPDTVLTIGNYAFANCSNVLSLTIPDSVTTIGDSAFLNFNKIEVLKIPNSVTSIGQRAFGGCTNLVNILVDENNAVYFSTNNSSIIEKETNALVTGCAHTTLDENIKSIKPFAFYGSKIKTITIPASINIIGEGAFANCKYLTEIKVDSNHSIYEDRGLNAIIEKETSRIIVGCKETVIDKSIKIIGAHAFEGVSPYTISFNKGLEKIESYAFNDNEYLFSVTFVKTITSVESHAFANCPNTYYIYPTFGDLKDGFASDWNK